MREAILGDEYAFDVWCKEGSFRVVLVLYGLVFYGLEVGGGKDLWDVPPHQSVVALVGVRTCEMPFADKTMLMLKRGMQYQFKASIQKLVNTWKILLQTSRTAFPTGHVPHLSPAA